MPKIKVELEKNETFEQAEDMLFKAVDVQQSGAVHDDNNFSDPAMADLINTLEAQHKAMYAEMLQEIQDELDKEYMDGY